MEPSGYIQQGTAPARRGNVPVTTGYTVIRTILVYFCRNNRAHQMENLKFVLKNERLSKLEKERGMM